MSLALEEAEQAFSREDFPVGAALVANGSLLGVAGNTIYSSGRTTAHAEHSLIYQHSSTIRQLANNEKDCELCLYTTLEPCLMCLGISVMHRISRIVIACPDPFLGTTALPPSHAGPAYYNWWPKFEIGLYKEASCNLIISFLRTGKLSSSEKMLAAYLRILNDSAKS